MSARPQIVEYPTAHEGLAFLVTAEQAAQPRATWRTKAKRLRPRSRLVLAAKLALEIKRHRDQAKYHEACDQELTARLRSRLEAAGILGFRAAGRVKAQLSPQTPRQISDPVGLITALGPWITQPGLIKGLSLDWDTLDELRAANPELAAALDQFIELSPSRHRLVITRLA